MEPESRKQERTCVICKRPFWSWGMSRTTCLQCDPIPPKLARIYREQIDAGVARDGRRMTLSFTIPGTPIPQARARHRAVKLRNGQTFVGQYDPKQSRVWKGVVADCAFKAMTGPPLDGPLVVEAVFVFPPLSSFPKRIQARLVDGIEIPKATKPDLDNLLKGIMDGMTGIVFQNDGQVWSYGQSRKVYGQRGEVRITITTTDEVQQQPKRQCAEQLALVGGAV